MPRTASAGAPPPSGWTRTPPPGASVGRPGAGLWAAGPARSGSRGYPTKSSGLRGVPFQHRCSAASGSTVPHRPLNTPGARPSPPAGAPANPGPAAPPPSPAPPARTPRPPTRTPAPDHLAAASATPPQRACHCSFSRAMVLGERAVSSPNRPRRARSKSPSASPSRYSSGNSSSRLLGPPGKQGQDPAHKALLQPPHPGTPQPHRPQGAWSACEASHTRSGTPGGRPPPPGAGTEPAPKAPSPPPPGPTRPAPASLPKPGVEPLPGGD